MSLAKPLQDTKAFISIPSDYYKPSDCRCFGWPSIVLFYLACSWRDLIVSNPKWLVTLTDVHADCFSHQTWLLSSATSSAYVLRYPILQTIWTLIRLLQRGAVWSRFIVCASIIKFSLKYTGMQQMYEADDIFKDKSSESPNDTSMVLIVS